MTSFALRRVVGISATTLIAIMVLAVFLVGRGALGTDSFQSGWVLLGLIVFLALYNVRKRLPFLPLGASSTWLQLHIYCGFLTFLLFLIHVRFSIPTGIFEGVLALLYLFAFLSGLVGLYITRTYPRRLTILGDEVIFEQIPVIRRQLSERMESLVLSCNTEGATSVIPEFYRDHIRPYMLGRHDVVAHLCRGSSERWRNLKATMDDQKRYLNKDERDVLAELETLVDRRHRTDAQFALQGALKLWLFLHIPATYALLVFSLFHILLVYAWSGGLS